MPRRAASQFLSQYPAEAEVLFGPLTGLEALNDGYICGTIRHFTIRPTVNQRAVSYDAAMQHANAWHADRLECNELFGSRNRFVYAQCSDTTPNVL